ncbi:MAG: thermonuclease [Lactobacillales bacterium]|nr:thermonuclease [Lactobacillales bacterium]
MKKIYGILISLFIFLPFSVNALEQVKFSSCVDGDTARFIYNNEEVKLRFLAIDTPEYTKEKEPFGKEASDYTCKRLKEAKKITIEFDSNSEKQDKYNRYLVWIYVDDSLLQKELISKGLARVAYLYDDYKYTSLLEKEESKAKNNKIGIWKDDKNTLKDFIINMNIWYKVIITVIVILAICIYLYFDKKARRKALRKGKKLLKEKLK